MKQIANTQKAYFQCLKLAIENHVLPNVFFDNLEDILEGNEKIVSVDGEELTTTHHRIIELSEII